MAANDVIVYKENASGVWERQTAAQTALTGKDAGAVNSGDATTDGVISNNRTRIEEIEVQLQALGILS